MENRHKFRGWHTVKKKMFSAEEMGRDQLTLSPDGQGFINVHGGSTRLSTYLNYMIPIQCTGLKDRNGKLIYEGDILFGREEGNGETTAWTDVYYVVFFRSECGSYMVRTERSNEDSPWCDLLSDIVGEYEVIGNRFENPELLK